MCQKYCAKLFWHETCVLYCDMVYDLGGQFLSRKNKKERNFL